MLMHTVLVDIKPAELGVFKITFLDSYFIVHHYYVEHLTIIKIYEVLL